MKRLAEPWRAAWRNLYWRLRSHSGALLVALTCVGTVGLAGCHGNDRLPVAGSERYTHFVSAFYEGLAGLEVGDDVRADAKLGQAAGLVPGEPAAWADWGVLALRQRNFDQAAQRLQRAHTLAPADDRIDYLLGLMEGARGNAAASINDLHEAIAKNPRNIRALYTLAMQVEQQGSDGSDAELEKIYTQILSIQPENLAMIVDLARVAAKQGDTATLQRMIAVLAKHSTEWPAEAKEQLKELQAAAEGPTPRMAATRSTFLRNVLMRVPAFRIDLSAVVAAPGEEAQPISRFLRLQNPSSRPAAPDMQLSFAAAPVPGAPAGPWTWAGAIALNGADAPVMAAANASHLWLASGTDLSFPAGAHLALTPENVLPFDYNYDFRTDLLLTDDKGLRLYRQDSPQHFTDVTAAMKLPLALTNAAYTGAWAIDLEADGDLDVVLGSRSGAVNVLRNNGDGTFAVVHPFAGVSGIRQFVWADLNGDGNPDASLIDGDGRLHVFLNERSGRFTEAHPAADYKDVRSLCAADTGDDDALRLHLLTADGRVLVLAHDANDATWTERQLVAMKSSPVEDVRLRAADLDNNGALDLMVLPVQPGSDKAQVWLQGAAGQFQPLSVTEGMAEVFDTADLRNDGHLDMVGLDAQGALIDGRNHTAKNYHWQTIRPRARQVTGDQRVNSFGIGGVIEIRSVMLLQKQEITSPMLHFGLGEEPEVNVARIIWPNGSVRAEFALKANQQILTEQRLKGSCPFLFTWNGKRMVFVKDTVPWGAAIGLRINALGSAKIAGTEEWYKIPRADLVPRDGFYDLRITGELWESYFYDALSLMTVDHPQGTEIFTDERFDVPAVKRAVTVVGPPRPILKAVDDRGTDVTDILRARDGRYLDTFGLGQYQGVTRDHFVEIDLGDDLPKGPLWLIARGWLHPSDSSVNVAMSQGTHEKPEWLSLEVPDGRGGWRVARPNLGFPAGRNKICLIDLSGLFSPGTPHRLRLRTNLEVYWDQMQWAQGLPQTPLRVERLEPSVADLHYRGFSAIHQANASSPEIPDYGELASTSPIWSDLPGFYTRYGDVRPLLAKSDDRYVIMNAGDEMSLQFRDPGLPPTGWVRDFIITGNGWIKDGDYNTVNSRTVLPYPYHARTNYDAPAPIRLEDDWEYQHHKEDWATYQTRYVTAKAFDDALENKGGR